MEKKYKITHCLTTQSFDISDVYYFIGNEIIKSEYNFNNISMGIYPDITVAISYMVKKLEDPEIICNVCKNHITKEQEGFIIKGNLCVIRNSKDSGGLYGGSLLEKAITEKETISHDIISINNFHKECLIKELLEN